MTGRNSSNGFVHKGRLKKVLAKLDFCCCIFNLFLYRTSPCFCDLRVDGFAFSGVKSMK